MNNTNNNISENTVNENEKIQYVNPLNPNEILKIKDLSEINIKKEEDIIDNTEHLQENNVEVKDTNIESNEQNDNDIIFTKPKRKNKLIIIIIFLIILAIILASILLIPKLFNQQKKPVVDVPQIQEQNKISLSNIITNSTNNNYYKLLTSTYTVNISNTNDSIIFNLNSIDQTNPISKQITFTLNNRDLKITLNKLEDNTDSLNAFYAVVDGIGQYHGHETDEVGNYLYSQNSNYNFNTPGITTIELTTETTDPATGSITSIPNNQIEIHINIDTNIQTLNLSTMYLNLDELNLYKDLIINNTVMLKKGDLLLYTNNSDIYTILIGQRKELNNITYNTISSVIELLYPEEITDFKTKFTSLSTISFDKYRITVDPVLNANTYPQYQSNYKFILIEITKQA